VDDETRYCIEKLNSNYDDLKLSTNQMCSSMKLLTQQMEYTAKILDKISVDLENRVRDLEDQELKCYTMFTQLINNNNKSIEIRLRELESFKHNLLGKVAALVGIMIIISAIISITLL